MIDKIKEAVGKAGNYKSYAGIIVVVILLALVITYVVRQVKLDKENCKRIDALYTDFPIISSINPNQTEYQFMLRDYYVKTAYNCCAGGKYKNDYVNTCALKACIKQGARCLDFEVYSVNGKPVVATSSVPSVDVKETYNSIDFTEAMNVVNEYAFSGSTCPNPKDPLILHFRIKSEHADICDKMSTTLYDTYGKSSRLLDKAYSNQYTIDGNSYNLGAVPLPLLMGKVIIIIDKGASTVFEGTKLNEYCNIASSSTIMRSIRNNHLVNITSMDDEIEFNKKNMTITMPDIGPNDTNISPTVHFSYGVQFVGMCFQNYDANLESYNLKFDEIGHAFILQDPKFRFVPVTIAPPTPQKAEMSYANRKVSSDYYSFNM